ncbi:MAG: thymidine phosphorylase [Oscillospiraceae bacterium]|nr:thymidine phosphorylase [Oscillospiraceae bacterium]
MRMYDIIAKKRDGGELSDDEISYFVHGYTSGEIPDYQASALLMAIYIRSMTKKETLRLTMEMADSGDKVDLSMFENTVDKHSTGGVGDKTTLIAAPVAAACGTTVAKMSGRGLGHTGGTVDKLDSIPGFSTSLSADEFYSCVRKIGLCVTGQSGDFAPADKKLYALRDVTATVSCIPLIASSIMSKKLAAGSNSIVLDVKAGSGAFMKTAAQARLLAEQMVEIGKGAGRKTIAIITDMDKPLGYAIGNSLEVIEACEVLNNRLKGELYDVSLELAARMIALSLNISLSDARRKAGRAVENGSAAKKFAEMISAQGGDARVLNDYSLMPHAGVVYQLRSKSCGYIKKMDTEKIGTAAMMLGAGRVKKEDKIDYSAGIILTKKTCDRVKQGEPVAYLHTCRPETLKEAGDEFLNALEFSDSPPKMTDEIIGEVT